MTVVVMAMSVTAAGATPSVTPSTSQSRIPKPDETIAPAPQTQALPQTPPAPATSAKQDPPKPGVVEDTVNKTVEGVKSFFKGFLKPSPAQ